MKVLLLAARDSLNVTYANLYKAFCRRGHKCIVVVPNVDDHLNNKVFDIEEIPYFSKAILTSPFLEEIDFAFVPPIGAAEYKKAKEILQRKRKIVFSFSVLFSSISVRSFCDIIFTNNQDKFEEFKAFGLKPRMVSIGDPRYDKLIQLRKDREGQYQTVKNVLIIDGGGYPFGNKGQKQFADILKNIAKNNPDVLFTIKLRYLPDERGLRNHSGSTYLYDYFDNMPPNLTWIKQPTVLEEIIADYDAAILQWSTAFYAVLALGIPMICIEGLESEDVFDVRTQRVKKAYDYLRPSGCVRHYTELLNRNLQFALPDIQFARKQLENYDMPCSDQYVDVMEQLYQNMNQEDLRFISTFQMSCREFLRLLPEIPKVNKFSNDYKISSQYYFELNNRLQAFAYENRCLAESMDVSELAFMYDYCDDFFGGAKYAKALLREVQNTLKEKKLELFTPGEEKHDRIWWFYYFRYLYNQKEQSALWTNRESPCLEGQYYYQALSYFKKKGKLCSGKYFIKYLNQYIEKRKQGICDIPILRDLKIPPSTILHYHLFHALYKKEDFASIEYLFLHTPSVFRQEIVIYFMMKACLKCKMSVSIIELYFHYNLKRPIFGKRKGTKIGNLLLNRLEKKIDRIGKRR